MAYVTAYSTKGGSSDMATKSVKYTTRIAPSPTGLIHLGTLRTAIFNWVAARATGGKFIVRIDDTDDERNNEDHVKLIYDTLEWMGLDYDVTFRQSEQTEQYKIIADALGYSGMIRVEDNGALSLNTPKFIKEIWRDNICGAMLLSEDEQIKLNRGVILKRGGGGGYTYNFTSVVDDIRHKVNLIIRGTDHISNTHRQEYIRNCILKTAPIKLKTFPEYCHVGLLHHKNKKLSKRDPEVMSVMQLREQGYKPDAIFDFLIRHGWSETSGVTAKKYTKDMVIDKFFTEGHMRSAPSNLNLPLLDALNRRH